MRLQLHDAIHCPDLFVLMLRYCANLKVIRHKSTSFNRIVADKLHRVIAVTVLIVYDIIYQSYVPLIRSMSPPHESPINTLSPHHMGGGGTNPPMCKRPRENPGYIYIW